MSAPSNVNAVQVGGDHYRSDLQHWDMIEQNGIGYLEGCASKYVTRWRKKNGREDLAKALHYIDKIIELKAAGVKRPPSFFRWAMRLLEAFRSQLPVSSTPPVPFDAFARANALGPRDALVVRLICDWQDTRDLEQAKTAIRLMLNELDHEALTADGGVLEGTNRTTSGAIGQP